MKSIYPSILALCMLCLANSTQAQLVTWTFNNLKITEGGARRGSTFDTTLTGTMDYDADTGVSSNVNLSYTGFLGTATNTSFSSFFNVISVSPNYSVFNLAVAFADNKYINYSIDFGNALLTNAGGTLNASRIQTGYGNHFARSVSGYITGVPASRVSAVPEPETIWSFGIGLLALSGLTKRRKA